MNIQPGWKLLDWRVLAAEGDPCICSTHRSHEQCSERCPCFRKVEP